MMDFPANPNVGQTFSISGGPTYIWDSVAWKVLTPGSQFNRTSFTATAGQTAFNVAYPIGAVDVFRNGVKLASADFTATNGTSITLANGCSVGDTVEVISYSQILYADVYTKAQVDALIAASGSPGKIEFFAMNTAPTGFLKANGALVSRTVYAALFAKIGTNFSAGDGSTTFGLPDMRGEFPRGWDDGRGVDAGRAMGSNQAHGVGPLTVNDPGHTHGVHVTGGSGSAGYSLAFGNTWGGTITTFPSVSSTSGISLSGTGTETRPRNVALLACIKY